MTNFKFSGKSKRREYWLYLVAWPIIIILLYTFVTVSALSGHRTPSIIGLGFSILLSLVAFFLILAVTVRRCIDIGISPLWCLLTFVPFINFISSLVIGLLPSGSGIVNGIENHSFENRNNTSLNKIAHGSQDHAKTEQAAGVLQNTNELIEHFAGVRNISDDGYKLYLSKKYKITKNQLFEKYEVNERLFDSIEETLTFLSKYDEDIFLEFKKNSEEELERQKISRDIAERKREIALAEEANRLSIAEKNKIEIDEMYKSILNTAKKRFKWTAIAIMIFSPFATIIVKGFYFTTYALEPIYDVIRPAKEGFRMACKNNFSKCGFLDNYGNVKISLKYDNVGDFSEGFAAVLIDNKWGFIDSNGLLRIQPKYPRVVGDFEHIPQFNNGLAEVFTADLQKTYFIDKNSKFIKFNLDNKDYKSNSKYPFFNKYTIHNEFSEDLAFVANENPGHNHCDQINYNYVDKNGIVRKSIESSNILFSFEICDGEMNSFYFYGIHDFKEGLAAYKLENSYGFYDKNFQIKIKPKYQDVHSFKNGYTSVKLNDKWGVIDRDEKIILDFKFKSIGQMDENNLIPIQNDDGKMGIVVKPGISAIKYIINNFFGTKLFT